MTVLDKILRRKKPEPEPQGAAQAELWSTQRSGAFLRKLGVSPTPAAAAPTPRAPTDGIETARQAFEADCAGLNRDIAAKFGPEHALYPFFVVPSSCWNGPHGAFLTTTLGLDPYGDWNIELCADNEASARLLGAPLLPYSEVEAYAEIIAETLAALCVRLEPQAGGSDAALREAAAREIKAVVTGLRRHWTEHCAALLADRSAA
jgi:hypothetical protein